MSEKKMMIVNEVSRLTGVSIRTLQYYDKIGLLPPADYTEVGYRLYDDETLQKLQIILLFRELEFPLKDIRRIIESPDFDREKALEQQIHILELKKEHIENLIDLARGVKKSGVKDMTDFTAFDTAKIDDYIAKAREYWGDTAAFKEFEEKNADRTSEENAGINKTKALEYLASKNKIVLIATHDPLLALSADRRIVIKNGGINKIIESKKEESQAVIQLKKLDEELNACREKLRNGQTIDFLVS